MGPHRHASEDLNKQQKEKKREKKRKATVCGSGFYSPLWIIRDCKCIQLWAAQRKQTPFWKHRGEAVVFCPSLQWKETGRSLKCFIYFPVSQSNYRPSHQPSPFLSTRSRAVRFWYGRVLQYGRSVGRSAHLTSFPENSGSLWRVFDWCPFEKQALAFTGAGTLESESSEQPFCTPLRAAVTYNSFQLNRGSVK